MGSWRFHAKVIAILVIPWVAAFDVVDFLLQLVSLAGPSTATFAGPTDRCAGENGTNALRDHEQEDMEFDFL